MLAIWEGEGIKNSFKLADALRIEKTTDDLWKEDVKMSEKKTDIF